MINQRSIVLIGKLNDRYQTTAIIYHCSLMFILLLVEVGIGFNDSDAL